MTLNDLLRSQNIDPEHVLVLRHTPQKTEPKLRGALPRLADEEPRLFNAFQQSQFERAEREMECAKYVASFIGYKRPAKTSSAKTLFVGLYENRGAKPITQEQFWKIPDNAELRSAYGMVGFTEKDKRPSVLWFWRAPQNLIHVI